MTTALRRLVHLLAAATVLFMLAPPAPALAAPAGNCPGDDGVTVVVDFGGEVLVRCAPGVQKSGLAALQNAGITVVTEESGVCRLQGKPEACAAGQWSYWNAWNGGTWNLSQRGVTSSMPPMGTFEGWSLGTAPPRFKPARPAQPASSAPTSRPQAQGGTNPGKSGGLPGVPLAQPQAAPIAPSPSPAASSSVTLSTSISEPQADGVTPGKTPQAKAAERATPAGSAEFPWVMVAGALVLGGVGAFVVWRRKRVPY